MNVTSLASFESVIATSGDSIIFHRLCVRTERKRQSNSPLASHEMPREPIHRRATGFVRARTSIDGIVAPPPTLVDASAHQLGRKPLGWSQALFRESGFAMGLC